MHPCCYDDNVAPLMILETHCMCRDTHTKWTCCVVKHNGEIATKLLILANYNIAQIILVRACAILYSYWVRIVNCFFFIVSVSRSCSRMLSYMKLYVFALFVKHFSLACAQRKSSRNLHKTSTYQYQNGLEPPTSWWH